jgi:uncharacterized membrane protein HdeD (DUF308 family)
VNTSIASSHRGGWSILVGVILILGGFSAIALPFFAGIAGTIFFGWLVLFGGIMHLIYAWSEPHAGVGATLWQVCIAIVYFIAAIAILLLPVGAILGLTLVLASYIAVEGILELVLFSRLRHLPGAAWFLVDGVLSLLLTGLILFLWPSSSFWALGTLLGISPIVSGIARLTMPTMRRRIEITV